MDKNGDVVPIGVKVIIRTEEAKDELKIEIINTSNPPASRIATIDSEVIMKSKNIGAFAFSNDGWMNSGKGTIIFEEDRLYINIDLENESYDNWSIFEGCKCFKKI